MSWRMKLGRVVLVGALAGSVPGAAWAADEGPSRGVNILEAPTPGPGPAAPPAAPLGTPSGIDKPAVAPPSAPAAGVPPSPAPGAAGTQANVGPAVLPDLGQGPGRVKVANPAELSIEILPGPEISIGTKVSLRVSTKKQGYLVLVDVDPSGKLTQIYPNPLSLMNAPGGRQNSNLIKPGKPVLIPNPADPYAGFEFVASPPEGTAMVAALLSDRPVQMIDLPDVPVNLAGQAAALTYLSNMAQELRIASGEPGRLQEVRWSVDAKFYAIR
jgi:hypothetical protein